MMSPMLAQQRAAAAYGQAAATLPPARQIVMLYDGALRRIGEARSAIEEGRIEDRFNAVQKACAILDGLLGGLDHEQGGDIARGLESLYIHLGLRLQRVNIEGDPAICDEVARHLGELRAAFAAIADGAAGAQASAGEAPRERMHVTT